jgi:hypothetical protein
MAAPASRPQAGALQRPKTDGKPSEAGARRMGMPSEAGALSSAMVLPPKRQTRLRPARREGRSFNRWGCRRP